MTKKIGFDNDKYPREQTAAELAVNKLVGLRGTEVHMTHIPAPGDDVGLKRLGVNLTTDGKFSSRNLFIT